MKLTFFTDLHLGSTDGPIFRRAGQGFGNHLDPDDAELNSLSLDQAIGLAILLSSLDTEYCQGVRLRIPNGTGEPGAEKISNDELIARYPEGARLAKFDSATFDLVARIRKGAV
jgi:hypothetical protein